MTQSSIIPASIIPVHVLTGFLGSGKTTLLNRALDAGFGPDTAVIVNEFGDIGLDQLFLQTRSEETIVLKSGCVCCTVRTDLVSTLLSLAGRRGGLPHPFRRIIVETSGISDPLPILQTLRSDFNLLTRFRVGAVVCTVDASQGGGDIQVAYQWRRSRLLMSLLSRNRISRAVWHRMRFGKAWRSLIRSRM
jgi:G3E family GTPase